MLFLLDHFACSTDGNWVDEVHSLLEGLVEAFPDSFSFRGNPAADLGVCACMERGLPGRLPTLPAFVDSGRPHPVDDLLPG